MSDFIFLWFKTLACKNEFTSECRLQTPTYSLFSWPLVFYPDKSLVKKVPLLLSRRSHHLSSSSLNATASPTSTSMVLCLYLRIIHRTWWCKKCCFWVFHLKIDVKGQFRYFEHWGPFPVCLGWHRNFDCWSHLGYLAHLESPCLLQNGWLRALTSLSLKQPWTLVFRNVQLTEWWVVFLHVPNQVW